MKINEIQNGMRDVELEAEVKETTEPREVNTKFGLNKVSNAVLKDDTGEIVLVLWGDKTSMLKTGDKVKITGAYIREWNNNLQLNVPKTGTIEVVQ